MSPNKRFRSIAAYCAAVLCLSIAPLTFADSNSENPAMPETTDAAGDKIVLIGASYARGWEPAGFAGLPVVNKGKGGEETHQMLARFDEDVIAERPRAVIIWGFINDIFRSSPDELEAKLVRSKQNLTAMIDSASAHGITPILATEVTITTKDKLSERLMGMVAGLMGKQGYHDYVNGYVRETNRWVRETAKERGLKLLDFEHVLADGNGERRREYASPDGSHLTPAAYRALTDYVAQSDPKP